MKGLIFLLSLFLFGQANDPVNDFLKANYQGGPNAFFEVVYTNILYPKKAREKNKIGQLKTRLHLSKEGKVRKVEFLNKLGYDFEEAAKASIMATNGHWLASDAERIFDFSFAFKMEGGPEIKGDVNVVAVMLGGTAPKLNSELLKKANKYIRKKKYKKAKKIIEELLRRDPDLEHYQKLKQLVDRELDKK